MRLLLTLLLVVGCGDDAPATGDAPAGGADGGGGADSGSLCPRAPAPEDRARKVVVAHPFDGDTWEVLDLSAEGELTPGVATFVMGRAHLGRVVFTPDGEVGLVAQDDGTLGVFRFGEGGAPEVVHPAFEGSFYASGVVMDPSGERAFVLDGNWRENGGGVYAVRIGCDGTLVDEGLLVPAKLPEALLLQAGGALLVATDAADSPPGNEAHLFDWSTSPPLLTGGASLFADEEAIVSDAAVTGDGRWLLVGDHSAFSSQPNRVAIAELGGAAPRLVDVVEVNDPITIVGSPFGARALVASGFGDAAFVLTVEGEAWTATELAYAGPPPQLPGSAVVIERGPLRGRVLLAENVAVRQLQFAEEGLTDLGPTRLGDGDGSITGAIGVQP